MNVIIRITLNSKPCMRSKRERMKHTFRQETISAKLRVRETSPKFLFSALNINRDKNVFVS